MSMIEKLARPEILAMKPYQSARNTAGTDGILLNANEVPGTLVQRPEWESLALNRYPVPQPRALTDRMATLYDVNNDRVLVTRGSDEGIDLLLRVFCRPGKDAIVECPPCFGMYRIAANIQGAAIIEVARDRKNDLQIDINELCRTIAQRRDARLVFLTTPNNPTGDVIGRTDLERIIKACGDHALLVLDEAYIEFCVAASATELLGRWPNLVVLRTLSKAWGAAGLRCGAVLANPEIIGLLLRVMAPYPLSAPAIDAALAITSPDVRPSQARLMTDIATAKNVLVNTLQNYPWAEKIWPGEANFVLLRVDDAGALVEFCADRGIRIRDFSSQDMLDNCVRLTIGSEEEMAALQIVLDAYGTG
jgi:histidinol-phosphate aminotransferase